MIGKYHRVIVTFSRWNDQLGKMEHVDKVARTDEELRTILGDVRYIGWNFSTIGFIKCPSCGREVACHRFTNTCDCGREFNLYGEELALRWEEETSVSKFNPVHLGGAQDGSGTINIR